MKITPNDIGPNSSTPQTVDSKINELLTKLASKPLLIDKLSISKDSGLQLILNTSHGKLQLQMPVQTAEQLQSAFNSSNNSTTTVELSLGNKNQFMLKLSNRLPANNNSITSPRSDSSSQNVQPNQLVFAQAKLIGSNVLKLESPLLPAQAQVKQPNKTIPHANFTSEARANLTPLGLPSGSKLKGVHTLASPLFNQSQRGKLTLISLAQTTTEPLSSVNITPGTVKNAPVDSNQIIKNFLRQSFPNKVNLASNINSLQKQIIHLHKLVSENFTAVTNSTTRSSIQIANQVITQSNAITQLMNQLTTAVKRPKLANANSIMQKVSSSGNLLENKLGSLNKTQQDFNLPQKIITKVSDNNRLNTQLSTITAEKHEQATSMTNNQVSGLKKNYSLNNNNLAPSDVKLLLVQIKAQVEKLVGQLNNLIPRSTSDVTNQALTHSSPATPQTATEQIRANLESTTNSLLRSETSPKSDAVNQAKSPPSNLINNLISIGQTNQMTKLLSEITVEVRSALNQIETNQLLSLRTEQPNLHQFLVDLPLINDKQIDSFELLFERKTENLNKAKKHWKVVVRFDLEPLGPMFAQVELKDNRISTDIFAESQPTAKLINEHLHILQKSLFEAGLDIDKLASSQGKIPQQLVKNTEHSVDVRV